MLFRRIIENPILVAVTMLLVTLMGILAVLRVPVQLIPDLDVRVVTIVTRWPGATPQDVEREILVEQEEYLRNVASHKELSYLDVSDRDRRSVVSLGQGFANLAPEALPP